MLKRLLFFAYGLTAYVMFLVAFLYAVAFVGGFWVARRLDGPLKTSIPGALAIDCALLMVFAVQHSLMARRWFKERWTRIIAPSRSSGPRTCCARAWRCCCCSGSGARSASGLERGKRRRARDPVDAVCARAGQPSWW